MWERDGCDNFADWLFMEMKKQGITNSELSRRTGLHTNTIMQYKRAKNPVEPTLGKFLLIMNALGYNLDFQYVGWCEPHDD